MIHGSFTGRGRLALPPFFDASKVRDALNETSINDLATGQLEMLEKWDWGVENFSITYLNHNKK